MWSILLPLRPVRRPAESCTTALQAGRTTTILFMVRLCTLAEPTSPALISRAYLYMVNPGQGGFQQPAGTGGSAGALASGNGFCGSRALPPRQEQVDKPLPFIRSVRGSAFLPLEIGRWVGQTVESYPACGKDFLPHGDVADEGERFVPLPGSERSLRLDGLGIVEIHDQ